jgi:hypothetical protein
MADFWSLTHPANPGKPTGIKDPNAVLDFPMDWSKWTADSGDSLKSAEILLDAPLTMVGKTEKDGVVIPFIAGGVKGTLYAITFRITTNSTPSRVEDRTVYLFIEDR